MADHIPQDVMADILLRLRVKLIAWWKVIIHMIKMLTEGTWIPDAEKTPTLFIMSDLPEEVIVNILLRLRVKDLFCCKCVSKQWLSIINDPHFIKLQLQHSISTNSNAAIFLQDRNEESPTLYWKQKHDRDISFFSYPVHYEPSQVLLMGSCHGLVCFSILHSRGYFVVLNPSTWKRHKFSCWMPEEMTGDKLVAYGFGYDESSDEYKVVRIIETDTRPYVSVPLSMPHPSPTFRAEIYNIRSEWVSWTIPLPYAWWNSSSYKYIGVFFGRSLHWCTFHWIEIDPSILDVPKNRVEHVIHVIDLESNTYRQLQCPDYKIGSDFVDFNVGIVGLRLSLFGSLKKPSKICIWVMEEYGNPESWNMIYCVDYVSDLWFPYSVFSVGRNGDEILLMLDGYRFAWCDLTNNEDETFLTDDAEWRYGSYEAIYCLESLVKISPDWAADRVKKDAYSTQGISQSNNPAYLDLRKLKALTYEDYYEYHTSDDEE